jgi:hypothetical protein
MPVSRSSSRVWNARRKARLEVQLPPDGVVPLADVLGRADRRVHVVEAALVEGHVGEAIADVLDEDLEVMRPLAVGQRGVDLTRLGVDEKRLDPRAVATEEGVGERAVAPEHAAAVEVHE